MKLLELFKELSLHPKNAAELKALILQLAVQGKLTAKWREENPDVEPAAELLRKTEAEKERLVNEKKIKKEKPLPTISAKEIVEEIPEKWKNVRLGEIGDWGAGATPLRSNGLFYDGNINWFKSGELNNGIIDYDSEEKITELALKKTSLRLNKPGDVLIAMYGATIGKTGVLEVSGTTNQAVCACTPFSCVSSDYLHLLLKALRKIFLSQGEGGAQPNISRIKIRNQIVSLPPLLEQQAIITTVNQLFTEVEQLEQLTKERIHLKHDFATSALQRLVQAGNINGEWAAVQQHFHTFFNEKPNVKKLRETILQLAVQGKLTTHWRKENPELEPASELLRRIEVKKKVNKSNKGKKESSSNLVSNSKFPYSLPENWIWCRFEQIVINRDGERKPIKKSERISGPYDYYGASGVIDKVHDYIFDKDLLLIGEDGANLINRSTPIAFIAKGKYWVNNHAHVLDAIHFQTLEYLEVYINAINLEEYITGMAQPKMPQKRMNLIKVPLPPLQEQHAIVTTVNTLMALCDALEQELGQQESRVEELMRSCVREVVE